MTQEHGATTRRALPVPASRRWAGRAAWSTRRLLAALALFPVVTWALVETGGGWRPGPGLWQLLVLLTGATGAITLASVVPERRAVRPAEPRACHGCAAVAGLTLFAAGVLLGSMPHARYPAAVALGLVVVGLAQRHAGMYSCARAHPGPDLH